MNKSDLAIGAGQWAHRDGYNVLYGDGSVSWYGDPQQRMGWMRNPWIDHSQAVNRNNTYGSAPVIGDRNADHESPPGSGATAPDARKNLDFFFWHQFDNAAGIDVGEWEYAPEVP